MADASMWRDTKYEFSWLQQGGNAFGVEYTERGIHNSKPVRLEITDGNLDGQRNMISPERMTRIHDGLRAIEEIIDEEHARLEAELEIQGLTAPRDKVHALVKQAEDAKSELRATVAQHEALRDEAQAKLALINNVHAQLDNALIEKRMTVDALAKKADDQAAQVEAKNAEIAHLNAAAALLARQVSDLQAHAQMAAVVASAAQARVSAAPAEEKSDAPG